MKRGSSEDTHSYCVGGGGVVGLRLVRSRRFKPKNNIYFFNAEMLISVGKNITENMKGISYI